MIRVLEAASDTFGQRFEKGPSGLGYGISCTNYLNTYVATMAQVSVDTSTGKVKVERVVCAQDMGEIINPQGARLQIEGGITMGLSAALSEELEFSGGEIRTTNRLAVFEKSPGLKLAESLLELLPRIHHDRSVPGNRLPEGFAGDKQEPDSLFSSLNRHLITRIEQEQ